MANFIFLFFVIIGIGLFVRDLYNLGMAIASRRWPSTSGQVQSAEIEQSSGYDSGVAYRAAIHYTFKVGRFEYGSNRVYFGDEFAVSWRRPAKRGIERYPPGTTVIVYYNPSFPKQAVLERGPQLQTFANIATDLLFAALGVAGLLGWGS